MIVRSWSSSPEDEVSDHRDDECHGNHDHEGRRHR
jgi:hypothetical protein